MKAIVTLVSGDRYRSRFARYCYANWKAYADKHGLELLVYTSLLDHSARACSRSAAWQKCLVVGAEESRRFEQVVWLDSDVIINVAKAPNVFEGVGSSEIGAVQDFAYPSREKYRQRLEYLFRSWDSLGIQSIKSFTPQEYMTDWGLPPTEDVVQTGVLVVNPEIHGPLFKEVYDNYEDKGAAFWHYEMRPLSYKILTGSTVKWLDPAFNIVTMFGVNDEDLISFQYTQDFLERLLYKLRLHRITFPSKRRRKFEEILKRLFDASYFLHFAGRQSDMAYLRA